MSKTIIYEDFLATKIDFDSRQGFAIEDKDVNPILKDHQREIVKWAVEGGRRAIFAAFGLGKTLIQGEILRCIIEQIGGGKALIVAPLGVRQEFKRDLKDLLGIDIKYVNREDQAQEDGFYITNYETIRDGKMKPDHFDVVTLDEASVLRSFGSKTYQEFLPLFKNVQYRFVATATPAPNKLKELIHYAGYLGIMDTGQALTRFFQRDSTKANNLTLYSHKEKEFWYWVNTWGIFIQKPSDLGFDDTGYALPPLKVITHEVKVENLSGSVDRDGQSNLFRDSALSLQDASKEKRDTLDLRVDKMMEILNNDPDSHYILWHDQESERTAIKKALPECKDVYGSLDLEEREKRIIDFSDGKFKYLATKPILSGSGCNFQRHCNKAIFVGIGYKFNDFIQAVHRIYRFLQTEECEIHIIYAETEREILKTLFDKWEQHKKMVKSITDIIKEHGLNSVSLIDTLKRTIGMDRVEAKGDDWIIANNDSVEEVKLIEDNSMGLIHTSIPFGNLYEYSPSYNDFGHNYDNKSFFEQMDYLTPELYRILQPGRIAAIHVKDRVLFGNATGKGVPTIDPFHMHTAMHYVKHGFDYCGMITIETDVVRENNQTYRLGWSEQCKDGTKMGVGCPEYILILRKPQTDRTRGYADVPVVKDKKDYTRARWQVDAHAVWRDSGNRTLTSEEMASYDQSTINRVFRKFTKDSIYDYGAHVKLAEEMDAINFLPATFMSLWPSKNRDDIWEDVNRMLTLNGQQKRKGLQMHVCPLQFDIVDRIIRRYSNEGDWVYDPFGGLGTVPLRAVKMGRKGRASELCTDYFIDSVSYMEAQDKEMHIPSLFDFEGIQD